MNRSIHKINPMRHNLAVLLLAFVVLVFGSAFPGISSAATYTVTKTADTNDGTCDADCSLREAVAAATVSAGEDTVQVPAGTYVLSLGQITSNNGLLNVIGAGSGTTTIDGNNASRIFDTGWSTAGMAFTDITLTQGDAGTSYGGCVWMKNQNISVTNSVFSNCKGKRGGAIYSDQAITVTVSGSTFSGNSAVSNESTHGGGAIQAKEVTVTNSTFSGNAATGAGGRGGAIYSPTTLSITSSTFTNNQLTTGGSGGAVYALSNTTIDTSTFTTNSNASGGGGAVYVNAGTHTITDSTFTSNSSTGDGGAVFSIPDVTVDGSTFDGNSSSAGLGGALARYGSVTVTNSTFSGNSSNSGGGAIRGGTTTSIKYSTFYNNSSTSGNSGGAVLADTLTTEGSIYSGNTSNSVGDHCGWSGKTSAGYNIDHGGYCGFAIQTGDVTTDPLLAALADNGGLTKTHAISSGPAVDGGPASCTTATGNVDQRDTVRPQGSNCDIGAYEKVAGPASYDVTKTADTNDGTCDADCSLREAIKAANDSAGLNQINVPSGTYTITLVGSDDTNALGDFDITDDVNIVGAGSGLTIIQEGTDLASAVDRIFHVTNSSAVTLEAMRVQFGKITVDGGCINAASDITINSSIIDSCSSTANSRFGGAIYSGGAITMDSSTVSNSTAAHYGGAISSSGGTLTDVTFTNNHVINAHGGAIYNIDNLLTINGTANTFTSNYAPASATDYGGSIYSTGSLTISNASFTGRSGTYDAGRGGAIYLLDTTDVLTLSDSSFTDLGAGNSGGAIRMSGGTLTNITFTDNNAGASHGGAIENITNPLTITGTNTFDGNRTSTAWSDYGGSIYSSGSLTISNTTFIGRNDGAADAGRGGAIYIGGGTLTLSNSSFSDFRSTISGGGGGAIYSLVGGTVTNSTFSNNFGGSAGGGAFFQEVGATTITNATFYDNTSSDAVDGDAIHNAGTVTLENTIVANSTASTTLCKSVTSGDYNLQYNGTCFTAGTNDISGQDPQLVALADNGGPTQTHALPATSPAIDSGNNTACAAAPVSNLDQRGQSRPVNGGTSLTCDMGAYEYAPGGMSNTTVGTITATAASNTSIDVSMGYTGDDNTNNTYTVDYKLSSEPTTWTNWVTAAANTTSPYTTTITGLTDGETYDVRMTFNDTDTVTGTNPTTVSDIVLPSNKTTVGVATAVSGTPTSIDVSMPYTDDNNGNNTYTVDYKLSSEPTTWTNKVTAATHVASPYQVSITGLSTGVSYDVRVTYNDADTVSGTNPQTITGIIPSATTYTVTKTADTDDGTCDADCSLREAIDAANADTDVNIVSVPAGTYNITLVGTDDTNALGDFDITNPVNIVGSGSGLTIIQEGTSLATAVNRIFHVTNSSAVTIEAVTVQFGKITATGGCILAISDITIKDSIVDSCTATSNHGGAIYSGGAVTLDNTTVSNGTAGNRGGAIYTFGMTITNGATISTNYAANYGGGVFNSGAANAITGDGTITFSTNTNQKSTNDNGGAIYSDGSITFTGTSSFTGNQALNGGAIFIGNTASTVTLADTTFSGNSTPGAGAGLYTYGLQINGNASFENNSATGAGAGIYSKGTNPVYITGTATFTNNDTGLSTGDNGGGIWTEAGNVTIDGIANFTNNDALNGGGIFLTLSTTTVTLNSDATFTTNNTPGAGAGLYTYGLTALGNLTLTGNTATGAGAGVYSLGANNVDITGNLSMTGNITGKSTNDNGGGIYSASGNLIVNGSVTADGNEALNGGAIYLGAGSTTISGGASFINGNAVQHAGAIYTYGLTISGGTGATFTNNASGIDGGAIRSAGANPVSIDGTIVFDNNDAGAASAEDGGGIYAEGNVTLNPTSGTSTFQNGHAWNGGAIYTTGSITATRGITFDTNTGVNVGGAIYAAGGELTGVTFSNNSVTNDGGAIYNITNLLTINGSGNTFTNNYAGFSSSGSDEGGAIYSSGPLTISNAVFTARADLVDSAYSGGAISLVDTGDVLTLNNVSFDDFKAGNVGGAIRMYGGTLTDVTITDSDVTNDGGAIYNATNALTIDGTTNTFSNNFAGTASGDQGGVIYSSGPLSVSNTTFTARADLVDSAYDGGALFLASTADPLTLNNVSFDDFKATNVGGAIRMYGGTLTDITITDSDVVNDGGAIFNSTNALTINGTSNTFSRNFAGTASGDVGGTIASDGPLTISNASFTGNGDATADAYEGGAIFVYSTGDIIDFDNVSFSNFKATNVGGAVRMYGGTMTNVTFTGNNVANDGGAIINNTNALIIDGTSNTFTGNFAGTASGDVGGAIYSNGVTTISNAAFTGRNDGVADAYEGGAIQVADATDVLTISNSSFASFKSTNVGGAFRMYGGSLTDVTFTDNISARGGAIFNTNAAVNFYGGNLISGNTATGSSGEAGGAVYSGTTPVTFNDAGSIVKDNSGTGSGGAFYVSSTFNVLGATVFENNSSTTGGGAFIAKGGSVTDSSFTGNQTTAGVGGGAYFVTTAGTIKNSTFVGNSASTNGGAFYSNVAGNKFINSTFSANTSNNGGAIYHAGACTIKNSTFYNNTDTSNTGHHIGCVGGTISNSIVYSSPTPGAGELCYGVPNGTDNLKFGDPGASVCGTASSTNDPLLNALAYNGGPTKTHALQGTGDAIATGNTTICGDADVNSLDQRGATRPSNCDLGAYEYGGSAGDTAAPSPVADLATGAVTSSTVALSWTAPGDDYSTGTATTYDVRYSTSLITEGNWASATAATGETGPQIAGTTENFTVTGLTGSTLYYFAIKTEDEIPNTSIISNIDFATTSAPPVSVAISGTVYTDEGATTIADGATVRLIVNGASVGTDTTVTGTYSINASVSAADAMIVYIDGHASDGTTVTISDSNALAGLNIYADHLIVRHDNAGSLTNANMTTALGAYSDAEILYTTDGSDNLTVTGAATELYVWTGDTYVPGATIDTGHMDVRGTLDAAANAINVSANWNVDAAGVFTSTGTVTFDATSGTNTITPGGTDVNHDFQNVIFNDAAGTATFQLAGAIDVDGAFTVTDGIVDTTGSNYAITVGGNFSQATVGQVEANASTITVGGDFSADGTTDSTDYNNASLVLTGTGGLTYANVAAYWVNGFNNLTVGQSGNATTFNGSIPVRGVLTVGSGEIAGSAYVLMLGTGDVLAFDVNSKMSCTQIRLHGTLNLPTLSNGYDCGIRNSSSNTVTQTGHVTINGNNSLEVNGDIFADRSPTYSTAGFDLTVGGDIIIGVGNDTAQKTLNGTNSTITVGGNFSLNDGGTPAAAFTSTGSTVEFNGTSQAINGSVTFNNLTKSVAAADTLTFEAGKTTTINGTVTLNGASGQLLTLASSTGSSAWNFNVASGAVKAIDYVSVSWSDASGSHATQKAIAPTNSTDAANNTDWFVTAAPNISVTKLSSVISDPISASNPKRIPGAIIQYIVTVSNSGTASPDANTIIVASNIDTSAEEFDFTTGVVFTDGTTTSALAMGTVVYSNDSGATYVYSPSAGFDPNITNVKAPTTGTFAFGGAPAASFSVKFYTRVK